jgi:hypothetical protein
MEGTRHERVEGSGRHGAERRRPKRPARAPNTKARAYTNFTGTQSAEKRTVSLPFPRSSVIIQSVSLPFRDDFVFDPYS